MNEKRINILRMHDEMRRGTGNFYGEIFNSRNEMMERDKREFHQFIDGKLEGKERNNMKRDVKRTLNLSTGCHSRCQQ